MKFETFGFERELITEHLELGSQSYEDEIEYLHRLLNEYRINPPELDPNVRNPVTFAEYVKQQIDYRKEKIEREKKEATEDDNFCRIVGERISVIRIFEAMKKTGIIESDTKPSHIVKIFFKDKDVSRKEERTYSNRSRDIINLGTKTDSKDLIQFVKVLIEDSFGGKREILQDLQSFINTIK